MVIQLSQINFLKVGHELGQEFSFEIEIFNSINISRFESH